MDAFTQRMTEAMAQQGQGGAEEKPEMPANKEAEAKIMDIVSQIKDAMNGIAQLLAELEKSGKGEEESEGEEEEEMA